MKLKFSLQFNMTIQCTFARTCSIKREIGNEITKKKKEKSAL